MTTLDLTQPRLGGFRFTGGGMLTVLAAWRLRYRTRRELRDLDAHLLADVGLTRGDAEREAAKPFWRP